MSPPNDPTYVEAQLVEVNGVWHLRVPLLHRDEDARRLAAFDGGLATSDAPHSRALLVADIEYHADYGRVLRVPLSVQTIAFSHREQQEGRLLVLGSTRSIETRYADVADVPRATVRSLAPLWIEASNNHGTQLSREASTAQLLAALGPDVLLCDVDVKATRRYIGRFEEKGYTANTIRGHIGNMKSLWRFLGARYHFEHNPWIGLARGVTGPTVAYPKRPFKPEESVALLNGKHHSPWEFALRTAFGISLFTGARRIEILSMRAQDLEETKVATWWNIRVSKTKAGIRRIPIVHPVARELCRLWVARQHPKPISFSSYFSHYRKTLGVSDEVDYHSARRTVVSMLERNGAQPLAIIRFVGHAPPGTTFRRYSQTPSDALLVRTAKLLQHERSVERALTKLVSAVRRQPVEWTFREHSLPPRRSVPYLPAPRWGSGTGSGKGAKAASSLR